jgi:hypothetical protein
MSLDWLEHRFEDLGTVDENFADTFPEYLSTLREPVVLRAKVVNQRWRRSGEEERDARGTNGEVDKRTALCRAIAEVDISQKLAITVHRLIIELQGLMQAMD